MRDLIVRMKSGGGEKTYVWFNRDLERYSVEWVNEWGTVYDDEFNLSANEAANLVFRDEWAGATRDDPERWPTKFFIRRAKAGIAIIDHAKENGL